MSKKISWKRLLIKSAESAIVKTVELTLVVLVMGVSVKMMLVTVPAVSVGAMTAKIVKIKFLE